MRKIIYFFVTDIQEAVLVRLEGSWSTT